MKYLISLLFIVGILFLSGCDSSSQSSFTEDSPATPQKVCNEVQVPYEEQEEWIEQEPYETVECHQESLRYTSQVTDCKNSLLILGNARTACLVTNLDSEYGVFDVTIGLKCSDDQWFEASTELSIPPHSSKTFENADLSFCQGATCKCEVTPPTKQVCENVVKYRDVTKYRTVTEYRTETRCN